MNKQKFDINSLHVASPCSVGWDNMSGDERKRFCDLCELNVYNIAEMTETEVESLIGERGSGRLCLRLYKRADGTVLTKDCPVGLRAYRKRIAKFAGAVLATILGLFSVSFGQKDEKIIDASKVKVVRSVTSAHKSILTGKIMDVNDAVIPGVEVNLIEGERIIFTTKTDDEGVYLISVPEKGIYDLKIKPIAGFKKIEVKNLEVKDNEMIELNLNLTVDDVTYYVLGVRAPSSQFIIDGIELDTKPFESSPSTKKP